MKTFRAPLPLAAALLLSSTLQAEEIYWSNLAGDPYNNATDGTGSEVVFRKLSALAAAPDGTLYGIDQFEIRRITPDGVTTTFAGNYSLGSVDGLGPAASFSQPEAIATAPDGTVFVADTNNHTIRKITPEGMVTTFAGTPGYLGTEDGTGPAARFYFPRGIAVDPQGTVYVSSAGTIRKISPSAVVTTVAGLAYQSDYADGSGVTARFREPRGLATDAQGMVYIADTGNHAVRKMTPDGTVTTLAGIDYPLSPGHVDHYGTSARFSSPVALTVDSQGTVYVVDSGNMRLRKITAGGAVTTLKGPGFVILGNFGQPAPLGVTIDPAGTLYFSEGAVLRRTNALGAAVPFVGTTDRGGPGNTDGTGTGARLAWPNGIAVDAAGVAYVADQGNSQMRRVLPSGVVTTPPPPGSPHSFPLQGIDVTGTFPVYVAVRGWHQIHALDATGKYSLVAGSIEGISDGTGSAARFRNPADVALAPNGLLYVADMDNHTIRKIAPGGVVTTLAGTAGLSGSADGMGAAARFSSPSSLATDAAGNIYVADQFNYTIRKITPSGLVSTLAGSAGNSGIQDGVGGSARFARPQGIAVDADGNVIVADAGQHTIRRVTPAGVVTTIGGLSRQSGSRDGLGSEARFNEPTAVAVAPDGRILVSDRSNNRIVVGMPLNTSIPDIAVEIDFGSPLIDGATYQFGSVLLGGAADQTLILRNKSGGALTGVAVTLDGPNAAEFTVVKAPAATVAGPSGSTSLVVRFRPGGEAQKTATLRIASNDPDESPFSVALIGRGDGIDRYGPGTQPVDVLVRRGSAVIMELGSSGYFYQWLKDGVEIPGAIGQVYTLPSGSPPGAQPWHIGEYRVRINNDVSTTYSDPAMLELVGIPTEIWRGLQAYYPFDADPNDKSRPSRPASLRNEATLKQDADRGGIAHIQGRGSAVPPIQSEPIDQQGPGGFIQIPRPPLEKGAPFTVAFAIKEEGFTLWHGESFVTLGEGAASADLLGHHWIGSLDGTTEQYGTDNASAFAAHSAFVPNGSGVVLNEPWTTYTLVSAGDAVQVYRNGEIRGTLPAPRETSGDIFLGRHWWDNGDTYSTRLIAGIDDVRVYNRALGSNEVWQLSGLMLPVPYDDWAASHGLTGLAADRSADPDNDTHSNWSEYAFGTLPHQPSSSLASAHAEASFLVIEWLERPEVGYRLKQWSPVSKSWIDRPAEPFPSPDTTSVPPGYRRMRAHIPLPPALGAALQGIFRVEGFPKL